MTDNTQNKTTTVLIAPDKFRGTYTSPQACEVIRDEIIHYYQDEIINAVFVLHPMADGGEGSLNIAETTLQKDGRNYRKEYVETVNAIGAPVRVPMLLFGVTALIEMAQVCGLSMLSENERDPMFASSYGLGEMIRVAIEKHGASKLIICLGGSATNDGGAGMLTALGFRINNDIVFGKNNIPSILSSIEKLDNSFVNEVCPGLKRVEIEVACDVDNPLLGTQGATQIFGRQKGVKDIELFEKSMSHWAESISPTATNIPGAGAAGGVGFALCAVLGAKLQKGWKVFAEMTHLEEEIIHSDIVITGEGSFDEQSLHGKLPVGIASICRKYSKPVWIICGRNEVPEEKYWTFGIKKVGKLNHEG